MGKGSHIQTGIYHSLQLLEDAEKQAWPPWKDITTEEKEVVEGLQTIIKKQFMKGNRPEVMLKKLREVKQGQKNIEEYLLEFENL